MLKNHPRKKKNLLDYNATGNRVKSARMLTGCTRKAFSEKTGISAATLRVWEEPLAGRSGITKKGAERFTLILQSCGIYCTVEWLLLGKGPGPTLLNVDKETIFKNIEPITWGEEEAIFKDIEAFKANNPNPIVAIVTDGSMIPFYSYGDYVGGVKRTGQEINALIGCNCIIELPKITIVRKISLINNLGRYTLSALNIDSSIINPVITDTEIISAAKIIWHRSREQVKSIII